VISPARRAEGLSAKPVTAEQPVDTLPEAIRKISEAMQRMSRLGLNRKAIIVLLQHETGEPQRVIKTVLDGLADLARRYTT